MKVIVVYESFWGNTAAIARAIAEGIGPEARVLSTAQASAAEITDADLLVVGSPVIAFRVPSDRMLESIRSSQGRDPVAPDLTQPSMRAWLDALPRGSGHSAAFETGLWWSPGGATGAIARALEKEGYRSVAKARRFIVKGKYGPLRDGELEKARLWGAELVQAIR